ncbi:MAG: amidase [Gammaproteobacteria bacterium]|nr:amidase [Gammaproteobacteria bacterium]
MHPIKSASISDLITKQITGELSAQEIADFFIAEVEAQDKHIQAFSWFSTENVRYQAKLLDEQRLNGEPIGPLHGIPVGLKDIINTASIPTENGSHIDAGRVPTDDAEVVRKLRTAGAIIFGKTRTTPFAFLTPCETRNPNNLKRTPGGSSSGSAAAVAAGMLPLALGTQTGGSIIRPASFCGVHAIKPSFDLIPREGVLLQSWTLDTIGIFARSTNDLSWCLSAISNTKVEQQASIRQLRLGVIEPPHYDRASRTMKIAMKQLATELGDQAIRLDLPELFQSAPRAREIINFAEMAICYERYIAKHESELPIEVRSAIAQGEKLKALEYLMALSHRDLLNSALSPLFEQVDALLMPAAIGEAPGLDTTGDAIFNGIWTLCGTPVINLPMFQGDSGLPMGLQIICPRGEDAKLLQVARQIEQWIKTPPTA